MNFPPVRRCKDFASTNLKNVILAIKKLSILSINYFCQQSQIKYFEINIKLIIKLL